MHISNVYVSYADLYISLCIWKTIMLTLYTSLPNTIDFVNYYLELKQFVENFNFSIFEN